MGVIRYKIWYDLWENKGRTWRVVVIVAIGAFVIGDTLGGKKFINQDVASTWQTTDPATIGLIGEPAVDETIIESLGNLHEVDVVGCSPELEVIGCGSWRDKLQRHLPRYTRTNDL